MNRKILSLILALLLLAGILSGCGEVASEIAGNVADAAMKELETQIKATFEKYKVDVIELKSAVGRLNGSGDEVQFFCAALVRSDSDALPQSCADALSKLFHDAGMTRQYSSQIVSQYLEHKDLSFKFDDFAEGETYYMVYAYTDEISLLPSGTETSPGVG